MYIFCQVRHNEMLNIALVFSVVCLSIYKVMVILCVGFGSSDVTCMLFFWTFILYLLYGGGCWGEVESEKRDVRGLVKQFCIFVFLYEIINTGGSAMYHCKDLLLVSISCVHVMCRLACNRNLWETGSVFVWTGVMDKMAFLQSGYLEDGEMIAEVYCLLGWMHREGLKLTPVSQYLDSFTAKCKTFRPSPCFPMTDLTLFSRFLWCISVNTGHVHLANVNQ